MTTFKVDYENGCNQCWEALDEVLPRENWDGKDTVTVVVDVAEKIRAAVGTCPHGAPKYAPSILIEEVKP